MVVPNGARRGKADRFYRWATGEGIAVQHILYAPSDVERLARHVATGRVPGPVQSLYVPGRYAPPEDGTVGHLRGFLDAPANSPIRRTGPHVHLVATRPRAWCGL